MPNNKASSALLGRIAAAAIKEFDQEDLYIAQAPAGVVLSDAHLDLLEQLELDRLKDPASMARLIELSQLVDCIQDSQAVFNTLGQDPSYLSDLFPQVVNNVEFFTAPLSDEKRKEYEQANGEMEADNPGLIPGYIHGLIFTRNLLVKYKTSARPPVHLSKASAKPTASFLMRAIQPIQVDLKPKTSRLSPTVSASSAPRPGQYHRLFAV